MASTNIPDNLAEKRKEVLKNLGCPLPGNLGLSYNAVTGTWHSAFNDEDMAGFIDTRYVEVGRGTFVVVLGTGRRKCCTLGFDYVVAFAIVEWESGWMNRRNMNFSQAWCVLILMALRQLREKRPGFPVVSTLTQTMARQHETDPSTNAGYSRLHLAGAR